MDIGPKTYALMLAGAVLGGAFITKGVTDHMQHVAKGKHYINHYELSDLTNLAFNCQTGKLVHDDCNAIVAAQIALFNAQQKRARFDRDSAARAVQMLTR